MAICSRGISGGPRRRFGRPIPRDRTQFLVAQLRTIASATTQSPAEPSSCRKRGARDCVQSRLAACAEQLGHFDPGVPTAEFGSFVGGDWNAAEAIAVTSAPSKRNQSLLAREGVLV
jgi:hypothetical protein